jgi:hypothetical protein
MSIASRRALAVAFVILGTRTLAVAQPLPTAQPNLLEIVIEDVKPGRAAEHAKIEAGWPAAYEKSKSTAYYLALVSMTGAPTAWYVGPWDSHAAIDANRKRDDADAVLSAELARLSRADSDMLNGTRTVMVSARKDLSYGSYPDLARQRFFEFTWFRVRPGHEAGFDAAAKAYAAAAKRVGTNTAFRVFEIIAGGNGPAYLVSSSVASYADFDGMMADGTKTMKGFTPDEGQAMQKFMTDGVISIETQRFRVDPGQSYVPKETRAQDPAFWMPKPAK